jgi:hypothetical protein
VVPEHEPWEHALNAPLTLVSLPIRALGALVAWRPEYPNPAFDERTERDILWGARIVAAFTDEHIHAAVAQGHYSDPRASAYLAWVLIERRDKIIRRWLGSSATSASRF